MAGCNIFVSSFVELNLFNLSSFYKVFSYHCSVPILSIYYFLSKRSLSRVLNFSIVSLKLSVISISSELAIHNNTNKLSPNSALMVVFRNSNYLGICFSKLTNVVGAGFVNFQSPSQIYLFYIKKNFSQK